MNATGFEGPAVAVAIVAALIMLLGLAAIFYFNLTRNTELGSNNIRAIGVVILVPTVLLVATLPIENRGEVLTLLGTFGGFILARDAGVRPS